MLAKNEHAQFAMEVEEALNRLPFVRWDRFTSGRHQHDGGRVIGRLYWERGASNPVVVVARWGPGGGPRNVLIRRPNGKLDVVSFPRKLRRQPW